MDQDELISVAITFTVNAYTFQVASSLQGFLQCILQYWSQHLADLRHNGPHSVGVYFCK
jgi:hypothetical protein